MDDSILFALQAASASDKPDGGSESAVQGDAEVSPHAAFELG